jgi:outer membrane protein OmpA-like peptidoglycan-associated protein
VLKSTKIKFLGIVGTFAIISTAYVLHAKTFYTQLYPVLNETKITLKSNDQTAAQPKVKIEPLNIEKPKKEIKPIEDETVVIVEENKSSLMPIVNELKTMVLSSSEKVKQILKEDRYLHVEKSGRISQHSIEVLEKIIPLLSDINSSYIEIEGHSASEMYNHLAQERSERFAQTVSKYLSDKKIDKEIVVTGYGDMYPIIDDKKDERNSRVELKIRRR